MIQQKRHRINFDAFLKGEKQMNYKWIIENQVAISLESREKLSSESIFQTIVTIEKEDFRLIWKWNDSSEVRHYMYIVGNYPNPTEFELYEFQQFINYEIKHRRKILLWFQSIDMQEIYFNYLKINHPQVELPLKLEHCKACYEKGCLTDLFCHTSSIEDGIKILSTGELLSSRKVRKEDINVLRMESRNAAGDPVDYFDYVMLSYGNCFSGDRLVTERRINDNPTELDLTTNFQPGIRYYFNRQALQHHPNFCCDGYHAGKVKDRINLLDHLLCCIVPKTHEQLIKQFAHPNLLSKIIFLEPIADLHLWTHQAYETAKKFNH